MEDKPAAVIVDVQNDFCHPEGFFPQLEGRAEGIDEAVDNIESLLESYREANLPVAFVKATGEEEELPETQRERYRGRGILGFLQDGSWGAELYRIERREEEPVFKKPGYDPFFNEDFREYAEETGELLVVGFFSDVCIDATARSADHLGIETATVASCSTAMNPTGKEEDPHYSSLEFMEKMYGTEVYDGLEEVEWIKER